MDSFLRAAGALTLIALVLAGVYYASQWNVRYGLAAPAALTAAAINAVPVPPTNVAPAPAIAPVGGDTGSVVTITGTLTYTDQQGRTVPYLLYTNAHGGTASKALAFKDESICVTSIQAPCPGDLHALIDDYGNGPVNVTGIIDDESLVVERIGDAR